MNEYLMYAVWLFSVANFLMVLRQGRQQSRSRNRQH